MSDWLVLSASVLALVVAVVQIVLSVLVRRQVNAAYRAAIEQEIEMGQAAWLAKRRGNG